jgi:hypothetical protein
MVEAKAELHKQKSPSKRTTSNKSLSSSRTDVPITSVNFDDKSVRNTSQKIVIKKNRYYVEEGSTERYDRRSNSARDSSVGSKSSNQRKSSTDRITFSGANTLRSQMGKTNTAPMESPQRLINKKKNGMSPSKSSSSFYPHPFESAFGSPRDYVPTFSSPGRSPIMSIDGEKLLIFCSFE